MMIMIIIVHSDSWTSLASLALDRLSGYLSLSLARSLPRPSVDSPILRLSGKLYAWVAAPSSHRTEFFSAVWLLVSCARSIARCCSFSTHEFPANAQPFWQWFYWFGSFGQQHVVRQNHLVHVDQSARDDDAAAPAAAAAAGSSAAGTAIPSAASISATAKLLYVSRLSVTHCVHLLLFCWPW